MTVLAGTIINSVRDSVPDPVYASGVAQPDADGLFRAQTMYRWLDEGARLMTAKAGYTITDWTALPTVAGQSVYVVNSLFSIIDQAYHKQLRLRIHPQWDEGDVYPNRATGVQSASAYVYRMTDHIEMGMNPTPSAADPATTLNGALTASATSIVLTSAASFLSFGYVLIEGELIQYGAISTNTLTGCQRGMGGTTAAAHLTAAPVTHLSFWLKGTRSPLPIAVSTSVVEMPLAWVPLLNLYVLAQCRISEQEFGEANRLLKEWEMACQGIAGSFSGTDPITEQPGTNRRSRDGVGLPPKMVAQAPAGPGGA